MLLKWKHFKKLISSNCLSQGKIVMGSRGVRIIIDFNLIDSLFDLRVYTSSPSLLEFTQIFFTKELIRFAYVDS